MWKNAECFMSMRYREQRVEVVASMVAVLSITLILDLGYWNTRGVSDIVSCSIFVDVSIRLPHLM